MATRHVGDFEPPFFLRFWFFAQNVRRVAEIWGDYGLYWKTIHERFAEICGERQNVLKLHENCKQTLKLIIMAKNAEQF